MAEQACVKKAVKKDSVRGEKPFDHPVYKKLALINGEINRMTKEHLQKRLEELKLDTRGVKEVLKKRLKNYYKKQKLMKANVKSEPKDPCYDYYLVIDFEATCDEHNFNYKHEIIEFPIVLVNTSERKVVDEFHAYVKPITNPRLTQFCIQLTGITQAQVDSADKFPAVLEQVQAWIEKHKLGTQYTFAVLTDGPWDMGRFMYHQCRLLSLTFPKWARKWCDLRKSYGNFYRCRKVKLIEMLQNLGMDFVGNQHSGIDDSRNIARILIHMLQDGAAMRVNEKLYDKKLHRLEKERSRPENNLELYDVVGDTSDSDCDDSDSTECRVVESLSNLSVSNSPSHYGSETEDYGELLDYYALQKS